MKKIIGALIFLLSSISLFAGHEGGPVVISYKKVPGQSLQYEITVRAFYESSGLGAAPPSSVAVNITSSCFPSNIAALLPRVGSGNPTPLGGSSYCGNGGNYYNGLVEYKNTITFPSHCADIMLWMSAGLGRFDVVDNLQSNYDTPYFYTKLNTLHGPNNSPQIPDIDLVQTACLNTPLNLFGYTDLDGDSLYFEKATAQKKVGTSIVNYAYVTGYSKNRPFGTAIPYTINPATGAVQAQVNIVGNYALATKYKEYRVDTATSAMVLVGEGIINYVVTGSSSCLANNSITIQHESSPNSDTIDCGSNKIRFIGSRQLSRGSLSTSGSDIEVFSKKQGSLVVNSATLIQDSIVEVTLAQAAPLGDTLSLVAKVGTDGNVIISRCGTELTAYDDTLTYYTHSGVLPVANATFSKQFLTAQFNAASSISDSVRWDFGDGNFSSSSTGNYTYAVAGTYTVHLIAFGICGSTDTSSFFVDVCDSISANFDYTQSGDTISFFSLSSFGISNFYWDFGDGQTAIGDSATHVYSTGGSYNAVLTATTLCGDTVSFTKVVETCLPPQASWTYTVVSTTSAGMTIDFDGTASTNAASFVWDFGDGTTDNTTLTPTHLYQTPGLHYFVKLTVNNTCQQSSVNGFKLNEIGIDELNEGPNFEVYPNPVIDVLNINLTENNNLNTINVYDLNGKKLVTQKVSNKVGSETIEFSVNHLESGSYLLELKGKAGKTFNNIVIKK